MTKAIDMMAKQLTKESIDEIGFEMVDSKRAKEKRERDLDKMRAQRK